VPDFHKRKVLLLSAGHFVNDCYSGFLAPLLPLFMDKHGLSVAQAGLLASVLSMSTSLSQPLYGYLADRSGRRFFLIVGPAITAVFMSFTGLAPSFAVLATLLVFSGAGSASFHPTAAAAVSYASGTRKEWGMSWFLTAGNFGHSLGPVVAIPVVLAIGLERLPFVAIIGVLVAVLLYFQAPPYPAANSKPNSLSVDEMRARWGPLALLFVVVVVRAFVLISFSSFIPIYLHHSGLSLMSSGAAVTLFLAVGSMGALLGGRLSTRLGGALSLQLSMLLTLPALWGFLHAPGLLRFVSLAAAGLALYFSFPVNVVMAQSLFPEKAGTVSALMIGVGWGTAGALLIPAGVLADKVGVGMALNIIATSVVIGLIGAGFLQRHCQTIQAARERTTAPEVPLPTASS
jgi:FSR family fosmidomycin resistance protein-like MFS transporter